MPRPTSLKSDYPDSATAFRQLFRKPFPKRRPVEPRLREETKAQIAAYSGLTLDVRGLKPGQVVRRKRRVVRAAVRAPMGIRRIAFRVNGRVICLKAGGQGRNCKLPALKRGTHTLVVTVTDGDAWTVQEIVRFRVR